jgi:hypothetical protein
VHVLLRNDEIQAGGTEELLLKGLAKEGSPLEIHAFIESNIPAEPAVELRLRMEYAPAYFCTFLRGADQCEVDYPREKVIALTASVGTAAVPVILKLRNTEGKEVQSLTVESSLFKAEKAELDAQSGCVELSLRERKAGVYYDYLRVVVNGADLLCIPVQLTVFADLVPSRAEDSVGEFQLGATVRHVMRFTWAGADEVAADDVKVAPVGRLTGLRFQVTSVCYVGEELAIGISMDSDELKKPGFVYQPLEVKAGGQSALCAVYGYAHGRVVPGE